MDKKQTIGSLAYDSLQKEPETRDPIELQRELQKEYIDELVSCVESNRIHFKGDFYVVVLTKKERLLENVIRNFFFARHSCPTPDYDQTVYRFDAKSEDIEYLWCIPDKQTSLMFIDNSHNIVPEEQWLLQHIIDFKNGSLYNLAKKLNQEFDKKGE